MSLSQLEFNQKNIATTQLKGAVGNIEAVITRPEVLSEMTPIIVISHPHPLYGGTMTNKVVHILAKTFAELNMITLRFNFRGVGASAGEFDHGIGEAEDLERIVESLRQWRPAAPIYLAGFSFGAYVSARAVAKIKPEKLLLVAPPVSMYPFDELPVINIPCLVIQGGQDEVIEAEAVKTWVKKQIQPPELVWMEQASHFFHGMLLDVKAAVIQHWQ